MDKSVTVHSAPAMHMSKSFGGAQQIMRDSKIIKESGFLGPYTRKLKVGDTQSMIFKSDDAGPWYLSFEQREAQRDDRATGRITRVERSKKLLTKALTEAGVELPQQRNFTRRDLQAFAKRHNIDVFEEKQQIIVGWQGQPKGLLHGREDL